MFLSSKSKFPNHDKPCSFNMTPLIDIVFLLIIFFLVVCRFIEAENLPVDVPDNCQNAQDESQNKEFTNTVTVAKTEDNKIYFAVGAEKIPTADYQYIVNRITELLDTRFSATPPNRRIVTLRIDKNIDFKYAQYALEAIAASSATDVKMAALKQTAPQ